MFNDKDEAPSVSVSAAMTPWGRNSSTDAATEDSLTASATSTTTNKSAATSDCSQVLVRGQMRAVAVPRYVPPHLRRGATTPAASTPLDAIPTPQQAGPIPRPAVSSPYKPPARGEIYIPSEQWMWAFSTYPQIRRILSRLCTKDLRGKIFGPGTCFHADAAFMCSSKYHICRAWHKGRCGLYEPVHLGPHGGLVVHIPVYCRTVTRGEKCPRGDSCFWGHFAAEVVRERIETYRGPRQGKRGPGQEM